MQIVDMGASKLFVKISVLGDQICNRGRIWENGIEGVDSGISWHHATRGAVCANIRRSLFWVTPENLFSAVPRFRSISKQAWRRTEEAF
jgi:hypothetical protein